MAQSRLFFGVAGVSRFAKIRKQPVGGSIPLASTNAYINSWTRVKVRRVAS
jgi:hypothetical protein